MKCEFCQGEYKNVSVHQRFCKTKKEAEEKAIPSTVPEGSVPEDDKPKEKKEISPFPAEEGKPGDEQEEEKPTEEQHNLVADVLKDMATEVRVKDPEKNISKIKEELEKPEKPKKDQVDLVAKAMDAQKEKEIVLRSELIIEFNEPRDTWEEKLCNVFKQVNSEDEINIKLKGELAHEFLDRGGFYRYPSDVFINLLRDYCSEFKDENNNLGGQTFICKRK